MESTLLEVFQAAAKRSPRRAAVAHDAGTTTYEELAAAAEALAGRLHEMGAGARVGVLLPNLPVFPLVLQAILRAGRAAVLLNPVNSPREVAEYLADAGASELFTTAPLLGLVPAGKRALLVDGLPGALSVRSDDGTAELPLSGAPAAPPAATGPSNVAAVLYTAANEGWARGAALTHRNLVANLRATVEAMALREDDRVLALLPLIHAFGLTVSLNATLAAGAVVIPMERFNPLRVLDLLEEERITVLAGVPAMFIALLGAAERREVPAHRLRLVICGGAPLDREVARRWDELFGVPLRQGYGLTEAGPVCLFNRTDRPNRIGTLGYPFPTVAVSIRDPAGRELGGNEVGELCVRGDNVFDGYLGEGGRSPRDFHGDWLRTGDLASLEPDGAVRFRGVLKPMFTRNGFNVYPAELERVLEADPRVANAAVCALPHPVRENDIIASIRRAEGAELTEEDVREYCRTHLAAYKQPARIDISG